MVRTDPAAFVIRTFRSLGAVWYENLSGMVIRPDKSRRKHRWCWWYCDWFSIVTNDVRQHQFL